MFSRYEQHNRHRDGRNNKADRTRHLWQPWVERAADYFDGEMSGIERCIFSQCLCTSAIAAQPQQHDSKWVGTGGRSLVKKKFKVFDVETEVLKFLLNCCAYMYIIIYLRCRVVHSSHCRNAGDMPMYFRCETPILCHIILYYSSYCTHYTIVFSKLIDRITIFR